MHTTSTIDRPDATFWSELSRTGEELAGLVPSPARVTAVVGPLAAVLPVVRHLQAGAGLCDVVALTPRAEVVCEPSWELVRSGTRLAEVAHRPGTSVLVIDVPSRLPLWVGPLVERLRRAGLELVHAVVDGDPDDDVLAGAAQVLGRPLAFDLASPIDPARLVALIDRRLPLASVRGVPLTPELVAAARNVAAHGAAAVG